MKIDIQSIHFSPDIELLDFINKKVEKLFKIADNLIKSDVYLKIEKPESPENKITEIRVSSSDGEYFAKKQCTTFEESVNLTVKALRKQVLKTKRKQSIY